MATYKLIQDVEAEDHILGPLTFRQFIYGLVAALCYYICFVLISKHVEVMLIVFLPIAATATFFAFPFRRDQPTEVWALAKIRFLFKPRTRIWSQSGIRELVTILVPKKVQVDLTKGLSQDEVQSRLKVLASTIDSRGWAVKNVPYPSNQLVTPSSDDRLVDIGTLPRPVTEYDVSPSEDMLDDSNPSAAHVTEAIQESTTRQRQELMDYLTEVKQGANTDPQVTKKDEKALAKDLRARRAESNLAVSNLHNIRSGDELVLPAPVVPLAEKSSETSLVKSPPAEDTHINSNIEALAFNSGLSIQSLAKKAHQDDDSSEVVVNLR